MTNETTILATEEIKESQYAGAGVRFSAGLLDAIVFFSNKKYRTIEDFIANTVVVRIFPSRRSFAEEPA